MSGDTYAPEPDSIPIEFYSEEESGYVDEPTWANVDYEASAEAGEYTGGSAVQGARIQGNRKVNATMLVDTLCRVFAGLNGRKVATDLAPTMKLIRKFEASTLLSDDQMGAYNGLLDVFAFEVESDAGGLVLNVHDLPAATDSPDRVVRKLERIRQMSNDGQGANNPTGAWTAFLDLVQTDKMMDATARLQRAACDGAPTADVMDAYKALVASPPPAQQAGRKANIRRVSDFPALYNSGTMVSNRIGCGLPELDTELSDLNRGPDGYGFIGLGEGVVIGGATGTGKTSASYAMVPGCAYDAKAQGLGPVLLLHTEEESKDKAIGASFVELVGNEMQRGHHGEISEHVLIENIGSSRSKVAEIIFEHVVEGLEKVNGDGSDMSIRRYVPSVVFVDYAQALADSNENERQGQIRTAELMTRGVQACDPDEISKFSGVDWAVFSGGMAWPEALGDYRIAVVAFAQLNKFDAASATCKPGEKDFSRFAKEVVPGMETADSWVDPSGNTWAWEVKPGDMQMFSKQDITGANALNQNATSIIMLHRSRPYGGVDESGQIADTRARMIIDKARNGAGRGYAALEFKLNAERTRARYFCPNGEYVLARAIAADPDKAATTLNLDVYRREGDPVLPKRKTPSPWKRTPAY
ncbi:MAG: hypothetical protein GY882_01810 [Actinomycetia bacterium]|nr:hypothetical protein [Actinomycetes bacterium]MCP4844906.1 hypothetical protein [Actinomycetes bacterium]